MKFLDTADLITIAARVLDVEIDAVLDDADLPAAEAALAETRARTNTNTEESAAALLHALVRRPAFRRGNERVALVATLQYLALNGWSARLEPAREVTEVLAGIRSGAVEETELREWLSARLEKGAGHSEKEGSMFGIRGKRSRWASSNAPFDRWTDRARRSVALAQEEARLLRHDYIGTEHLLLGLLRVPEGVAGKVLQALGVSLGAVRTEVREIVGLGSRAASGYVPFTPRVKKVLELSLREALQLGHNYLGTEHILLGIVREGEGVAVEVMRKLGVEPSRARPEVIKLLAGFSSGAAAGPFLSPREVEAGLEEGDENALTRSVVLQEIAGVFDENERLRAEVERLRGVLRRHGIEPDGGQIQTA